MAARAFSSIPRPHHWFLCLQGMGRPSVYLICVLDLWRASSLERRVPEYHGRTSYGSAGLGQKGMFCSRMRRSSWRAVCVLFVSDSFYSHLLSTFLSSIPSCLIFFFNFSAFIRLQMSEITGFMFSYDIQLVIIGFLLVNQILNIFKY